MTQLNISDVEDAYLNADLHKEWKEEFEKKFYKPLSDIILMDAVMKLSDEELEEVRKQDPLAWKDLMEAKEQYEAFQERKKKQAERRSV